MQSRKLLAILALILIGALTSKTPHAIGHPARQSPSNLQIITPENAPNLTQVERWGRGFMTGGEFSPDSQILAIQSTLGVWVYIPDGAYGFQEPYLLENEHGGVSSMIFHPVENTLVVGNRDGTLSFWDVMAGTELKTIEAHQNAVTLLAFNPDGTVLASADTWVMDHKTGEHIIGILKLWDWAEGNEIRTVLSNHRYAESISPFQIAFTPDGTTLVVFFANLCTDASPESLEFFDIQTGQPIEGIEVGYPEKWTDAITFELNQTPLLVSDFFGLPPLDRPTVIEWDETRQQTLNQIIGDAAETNRYDIVGSPNGSHLLIDFSGTGELVVWNFEENTFQAKLPDQAYGNAIFSPDGQKLVLTMGNGFTYYDISNQFVVDTKYTDFPIAVTKMIFSGTQLGTLNGSGIQIWNTENWREIASHEVIGVKDFDFSPDGQQILFGDYQGYLFLWDIQQDTTISFPAGRDWEELEPILSVAFNPDPAAERIFASGRENGSDLWKQHADSTYEIDVPLGLGYDIAFSRDGKLVASVGFYDGVSLGEVNFVMQGRLSPENSAEAVLMKQASEMPSYPMQSSGEVRIPISVVAFSPDNSIIATGAGDFFYCYRSGNVQVWSVPDLELLATLEDHTEEVTAVIFSPDGSLLASSSEDGTIHIRRSDTYEILVILEGHLGYSVNSIAFSPDGRLLFSAGGDGVVRQWGIPE